MLHCMILIIFPSFFQGNFYPARVDHSVVCLLTFMSRPSRESNQVHIQNQWSSMPDNRDPVVFLWWIFEDLKIVSFTLLLYSYLIYEDLEDISWVIEAIISNYRHWCLLNIHCIFISSDDFEMYIHCVLFMANIYIGIHVSHVAMITIYDMDLQCTCLTTMLSFSSMIIIIIL